MPSPDPSRPGYHDERPPVLVDLELCFTREQLDAPFALRIVHGEAALAVQMHGTAVRQAHTAALTGRRGVIGPKDRVETQNKQRQEHRGRERNAGHPPIFPSRAKGFEKLLPSSSERA